MSNGQAERRENPEELRQQVAFWQMLFEWFVHDFGRPITSYYVVMQGILESRAFAETDRAIRELLPSVRATANEVQSLFKVAQSIAFHRYARGRRERECSIAGMLQRLLRDFPSQWREEPVLLEIDESVLTAPPQRVCQEIAKEMFSHLVLFATAISRSDRPVAVTLGAGPREIRFNISICEPGLTTEEVSRIWISPEQFLRGQYPDEIFSRDREAQNGRELLLERTNFGTCLAIPAALLVAPYVPCSIKYELQPLYSLVITVFLEEPRERTL